MPQDKPTRPDDAFGSRFAKSLQYGFFLYDMQADTSFADIVRNADRYVPLILNPQTVIIREPYATASTPTQGGGLVIESRGGIIKHGQISGTTAYLPVDRDDDVVVIPSTNGRSLTPTGANVDNTLGKRSGFLAFHRLRYIFRLYQYERRRGNTKISLHWFDIKNDELWRIEPQEFTMRRQARRSMLFDYDISFQLIEQSNILGESVIVINGFELPKPPNPPNGLHTDALQRIANTISSATNSVHAYGTPSVLDSVSRMRELSGAAEGFVNKVSGAVQRTFQNVIASLNNVVGFFDDIHSTFVTALSIPLAVLGQLNAAVDGARAVWFEFASDNIHAELNEWAHEIKQLTYGLISYHLAAFNQAPGQDIMVQDQSFSTGKAKSGFTNSLMQETDTSAGSPDQNPVLGASGLSLQTNVAALSNVKSIEMVPIQVGDSIYTIAQRELGDIRRAIDLIVINELDAPYIVADSKQKPPNTLAWSEFIGKPSTQRVSQVEAQSTQQLISTYSSNNISRVVSSTVLVDNQAAGNWFEDQWVGFTITLTHASSGVQETRVIVDSDTHGTLTLNYAFNVLPIAGVDSYTLSLQTFAAGRPVQEDVKAFGSDFLLKWSSDNKATIVLNANRDIARVSGLDNLFQAIRLRCLTEPGSLPWHTTYGVAWPTGRPWDESSAIQYTFFVRRSLLNDRRIAAISNAKITLVGTKFTFEAEVQPIKTRKSRKVKVSK